MSGDLPDEFTVKERDITRGLTYITNVWRDDSGEWHADGRIQMIGLGLTLRRFPPEEIPEGEEHAATLYEDYTVIDQ